MTQIKYYGFEEARHILGISRQGLYNLLQSANYEPAMVGAHRVFTKGDILYLNTCRERGRRESLMFTP